MMLNKNHNFLTLTFNLINKVWWLFAFILLGMKIIWFKFSVHNDLRKRYYMIIRMCLSCECIMECNRISRSSLEI